MTSTSRKHPAPRLVLVTGKGGVGKTTVAVTLGRHYAEQGARVLILEIDPRESAFRLLSQSPTGGDLIRARPNLYLQNLRPRTVINQLVREQVVFDILANRVLTSPIYEHFVDSCPGLAELAVLSYAKRLLAPTSRSRNKPFDRVILDAPATGHSLALLAAPALVAGVIEKGPFGKLAADLSSFVADDSLCGIVAVTTPDPSPVQETLELIHELKEQNQKIPYLTVANGIFPAWTESRLPVDTIDRLWKARSLASETGLKRLHAGSRGPIISLPWTAASGPQLVSRLSAALCIGRVSP